jgi:hypothetical protein
MPSPMPMPPGMPGLLPAPAPVPPPAPPPEPKPIKLSDKAFGMWKAEIRNAETRRDRYLPRWQQNVKAFEGAIPGQADEAVWVNKDYPRVKGKLSQLFFRVPEVQLRARQPQFAPAAPVYGAALNQKLRSMGVEYAIDEALTDVLCPAGLGAVVVGYEVVTESVQRPSTDLTGAPPEVGAALVESGLVEVEKVDVPIHEEYYVERISPAKFLWPASFKGSDWQKAAWLGYEFEVPLEDAKRKYKLPDEFQGVKPKRENDLAPDAGDDATPTNESMVRGWVIWYRAHLYDKSVKHPMKFRRLVIVDGHDKPVRHEDSPYQRWDAERRRWIGMTSFPIKPITLTYVPDKAVPPSDAQLGRPQVNELIRSRTLMMAQRERSLPVRWYDTNQIDDEASELLRNAWIQSWVPLQGPGERALGEIARANFPRENFEFDNVITRDLDETWSMSPNAVGGDTVGETTAEEVQAMQRSTGIRLDYERNKVLRWFVGVAEAVGSLMQLFSDDQEFAEVVGADGAKRLQVWDRTQIQGEFAFECKPDSQLRLDAAQARQDSRNLYQFLANDPHVNRTKLLEDVLRTHNLDPATIITQPPPKGPEAPNVSYRFSGDDLNPLNPNFPIVLSILQQTGIRFDPKLIQAAHQAAQRMMAGATAMSQPYQGDGGTPPDTKHGGLPEQVQPLSKHHESRGTTA